MNRWLALALVAALPLAGCDRMGQREGTGAVLGGAAGGLLGSQLGHGSGRAAMTALGAVAGLLVGSSIGRSMDDVDRMKHEQAASRAFEYAPTGRPTSWQNPDNGHYGSITPTRTYQRGDGVYCREFTQVVNIGGTAQQAYGTACRQPDGTWKVVSS